MSDPGNAVTSVSVVGLGKLGSPLAATLASKGFEVIGLDLDEVAVNKLNQGLAPVEEPGLESLLASTRETLRATLDFEEAVLGTDICCIVVPTPSGDDGAFKLERVLAAAEKIGTALGKSDRYHVVSIVSTVMPGDSQKVMATLELSSDKRCGVDFGLCYSPEFIALGRVIHDLLNPDVLLIGESDPRSGDIYESVMLQLVDNEPSVRRMNFANAELSKLAVNAFVTTKITYANMLARICEKIPGADVDVVASAIGMDSRIGPKYLKGAVAFGGPCFPRDNIAFARAAERVGAHAPIAVSTDKFNRRQTSLLVNTIKNHLPDGGVVAVLGLSYKPDTPVVEESASLSLIKNLLKDKYRVISYDPMAMGNAEQVLGAEVEFAQSARMAIEKCDLAVIMTPWVEFQNLDLAGLESQSLTIIDAWRILDEDVYLGLADIIPLGIGPTLDKQALPSNA